MKTRITLLSVAVLGYALALLNLGSEYHFGLAMLLSAGALGSYFFNLKKQQR